MASPILPRRESLDLPDSPRMLPFRLIEEQIRKDYVLSRVVRPHSIRSWRGEPSDRPDFSIANAPAIRLTPHPVDEQWWVPNVRRGTLTIDVELLVSGCCVDDLDNLWQAIHKALSPSDPTSLATFEASLRGVGAWQGTVNISRPAFDPRPEAGSDGMFHASGQLSVEYQYSP